MACIVCGAKRKLYTIKLGHGEFQVCNSGLCRTKIAYTLYGYAPILGFNLQETVDQEHFSQEELDAMNLNLDDELLVAREFEEHFWGDDTVSEIFNQSIEYAAKFAEELSLRKTPKKDRPLKIGTLKFEENEAILERMLKGNSDEQGKK